MHEIDVLNGWKEMMGIAIANRTVDLKIINKVLIITLDSAVIREELQTEKWLLLSELINMQKRNNKHVWFK